MTDDSTERDELPPLPTMPWLGYDPDRGDLHGYSHDEMRAYARAALDTPRPDGQAVADAWPAKPTAAMRNALRTGSRRDCPSDELCDVRYAALLAALATTQGEGRG